MQRFPRRSAFAASIVIASTACLAGVNEWTPVGPAGGYIRSIAIHPTTADVFFAAAGNSLYRSTDSGLTWTAVRSDVPNGSTDIVIDPTNPSRILASGVGSLYRSDDGGLSFAAAVSPATPNNISTLALAANTSTLYLASFDGKVFRSDDFGAAWVERSQGLPLGTDSVRDLVADPQATNTLFALTTSSGIYRSTDGGQNWALRNALAGMPSFKVAVDPGDSTRLLLATAYGLYGSQDAGATWQIEPPGQVGNFTWVGYHPATTVGAAIAIQDQGPTLRRASRAATWTQGAMVRARVEHAAFDPRDTDPASPTVIAASNEGPLYTTDGGATVAVRSQGIRAATAYALVGANDAQGSVYAAFSSGPIGVHRRTPSGWVALDNVELRTLARTFQPLGIAVDPSNAETLLVASTSNILKTIDGGQSWTAPNTGLPNAALPRVFAFAPSNPLVVYTGLDGQGVYRSTNTGDSWAPRSAGLPSRIGVVVADPNDADFAYAADIPSQGNAQIFKTVDAGITWVPAAAGLTVESIDSIAIDPTNPQVLYAGGVGNGEGMFKTTNGGQNWTRVGAPIGDAPGVSIAVDPIVPTNVVMAMNSIANGAARSVDGGATWEEIMFPAPPGGLPHLLNRVILDPKKPSVILGTSYDYGLVEFEVAPDIEVTLPMAPATLALGGSGNATVRVRNHGPLAASAVVLTATLPAGMTAVATPGQGSCTIAGASLSCQLGAVGASQNVDTVVTLTAGPTPTPGALNVSVAAHESDPTLGNNAATTNIATERIANLGVTLASPTAVDKRSAARLTATVTNAGPNASPATEVVVSLGPGLTYQSANPSQGTCNQNGSTITCALGALAGTDQATIAIDAVPADSGQLQASASVSATVLDLAPANDAATATLTSRDVADASLQLADATDPVTSGQPIQYTITVTNAGPDSMPTPRVNINLNGATNPTPFGIACIGASSGSTSGIGCALASIASGGSVTLSFSATAGPAGTASATAEVSFDGTDPAAANNTATQSTTVNAPPSGGGGGGAADWLSLLLLLSALGAIAGRRRPPQTGSSG